jgi:hypothetical protein
LREKNLQRRDCHQCRDDQHLTHATEAVANNRRRDEQQNGRAVRHQTQRMKRIELADAGEESCWPNKSNARRGNERLRLVELGHNKFIDHAAVIT